MLKRIICTLLLTLVSFGFSVNVSATERFKWITSTDSVTISYDTQSVKYYTIPVKTVDVWILTKFTKEDARKNVEGQRAKGLQKEAKWDNFSYWLLHQLISKNYFKLIEVINYDVNGKVIDSTTFKPTDKWESIVPNTPSEAMRNEFIGFFDS